MAGYLPARLIPLLGVSTLDDIDETSLHRLIGVDEAPDLEFKGENYEASDGKRKELAYDIADRANHVGGLIIVGIEEEAGRAISLSPVEPDPHGAEETTRILGELAGRHAQDRIIDVATMVDLDAYESP